MGRAPCCDKNGIKKGPWTPEEDQKLLDYINKNGYGNWRTLPTNAGLQRCGKSCRLRWTNYLRPDIKRGKFSFEEEESIIQLHSILGNKWSAIAARLPGRTDNEIKNYWNTHIRKRLLRMGIDPVTHSPRLDLLDLSAILNSQSQINFSRLLGMQNLINPELIKLASSLLSTQHHNQEFLMQNHLISENNNSQLLSNRIPTSLTQPCQIQNPVQDFQVQNQLMQYGDVSQSQQDFCDWQQINGSRFSTLTEEYGKHYNYYGSDLSVEDPNPSVFSNISSSTPSSSPIPLNSNSTYINSSCTTAEDERESYCSKFEIPDHILNVNDFM
ncbi:hypothetical protein ACJIZ3_006523 [Penstemon smallii]|uniref:Uncharacterized protein n=1 Tax=Penstemon smallii TaxID=265156 RepID=A0ABD3S8G3_9LAMI